MATTTTTPKKAVKPMETHVDRTATPYTGPTTLDVTKQAGLLNDLPKGARKGMRASRKGIDDVVVEVLAASPAALAAAGIPPALAQAFATSNANVAALSPPAQVAAKLAEVLDESLAIQEDAREQQLGQMGDAIRSTAKRTRNESVKAPFQNLLAYLGEGAAKALKTRTAKKAGAPPATGPAGSTTTTTTGSGH